MATNDCEAVGSGCGPGAACDMLGRCLPRSALPPAPLRGTLLEFSDSSPEANAVAFAPLGSLGIAGLHDAYIRGENATLVVAPHDRLGEETFWRREMDVTPEGDMMAIYRGVSTGVEVRLWFDAPGSSVHFVVNATASALLPDAAGVMVVMEVVPPPDHPFSEILPSANTSLVTALPAGPALVTAAAEGGASAEWRVERPGVLVGDLLIRCEGPCPDQAHSRGFIVAARVDFLDPDGQSPATDTTAGGQGNPMVTGGSLWILALVALWFFGAALLSFVRRYRSDKKAGQRFAMIRDSNDPHTPSPDERRDTMFAQAPFVDLDIEVRP